MFPFITVWYSYAKYLFFFPIVSIVQVDSHFCSNCLENIPSAEAKLKKNRCNKCFDCPSCHHTLSSRAVSVQVPRKSDDDDAKKGANAGESKPITRKMYYLACLACRWTSRDVGIPDQMAGTIQWQCKILKK